MRLLIAEDQQQIREGMCTGICWKNYGVDTVKAASDGVLAWEEFSRKPYDIVLTDIRMPGMDGIELSRKILALRPQTQILVFSGYSEFDYVYSAMKLGVCGFELKPVHADRIIRFVTDAVTRISLAATNADKSRRHIEAGFFLSHLCFGNRSSDAHEKEQIAAYFNMPLNCSYCLIAVRPFPGLSASFMEELQIRQEFFRSLEHTMQTVFTEGNTVFWRTDPENALVLCFFKYTADWKVVMESRLRHLLEKTCQNLACTAACAVVADFAKGSLRLYYERSRQLLEYVFYLGREVILFDSPAYGPLKSTTVPLDYITQLKQAVENSDGEVAWRYFAEVLDKIIAEQTLSAAAVRNYCADFLNVLRVSIAESRGGSLLQQETEFQRLFQIPSLHTIAEYRFVMEERCRGIFLLIGQDRQENYSPCILKSVKFVQENYAKNLTIEEVALSVGKSPNYFSRLFNAEMGVSFPEYVARVRVAHACQLLDNPVSDYLVYEIAGMTGFTDYKYFSKIFRKITGCSVTNYKKKIADKKLR